MVTCTQVHTDEFEAVVVATYVLSLHGKTCMYVYEHYQTFQETEVSKGMLSVVELMSWIVQ